MRYTGTYSRRERIQCEVFYRRATNYAKTIKSSEHMKQLLHFCKQLQAVDSGRASRAQQLKHDIHIWADYHDDLKELELMRGLVIEAATIKQRRAAREARWERERKEKGEFYATRSAQ